MPWGRPMKWKTVDEITPLIEAYFTNTPKEERTITWLALALDTSRTTLIDYEHRGENGKVDIEFTNTIKKAKDMVENSYEIDLKKKWNTWSIFALKNFDWKDKSEVDMKQDVKMNLSTMSDEELLSLLGK